MPELLKRIPLFVSRFNSRLLLRVALLSFGPAVLLVIGAYYYATGGRLISTENAYVKADKIAISTDISGRVSNIHVNENQRPRCNLYANAIVRLTCAKRCPHP